MRQLRDSKQWTQEKLAERADMAKTHIGHIETGRRWPKPESIEAIAKALGVPSSELFQDRDYDPPPSPEAVIRVITDALKKP